MTALTDYGVELSVELGIGRQANAAVWDAGKWDSSAVWGQPATALGDWVEVTCDTADSFTLTAGASEGDGVVTRWEAATCALTLHGAQYDPWSGPWSGILGPMVPVRVRWRPVPVPGAKIETLTDTFDTRIDPAKWTLGGAVWNNGRAALTELVGANASMYSVKRYDLRDSAISAKITPVSSRETWFAVTAPNGDKPTIGFGGGGIYFYLYAAGVWLGGASFTYDPIAHAWWRIRMTGGILYWETSPDGAMWTIRQTMTPAPTVDMSSMDAGFYVVSAPSAGVAETAYVDNVNVGPWRAAFTGAVAADGWDWVPGSMPYANVNATDSTQVLAAYDPVERSPIGLGETAAERVNRILDIGSWPANLRDVTAGGVKLKSSTMAEALWTQLLAVADTDLALMWVKRDGRLAFRPEGRIAPGVALTSRLVICPDKGPVPGTNYVANPHANDSTEYWNCSVGTLTRDATISHTAPASFKLGHVPPGDSTYGSHAYADTFVSIPIGTTLRWSTWIKADRVGSAYIVPTLSWSWVSGMHPIAVTTEWQLIEFDWVTNVEGTGIQVIIGTTDANPITLWFDDVFMGPLLPPDPNDVQVVTIGGAQFSDIRNVVSVSRQKEEGGPDAATVTVYDDSSAARYFRRAYSRTDLQHQDDSWSTTVANAILASSAWPSRAPRDAVLSSRVDTAKVPALLLSLEPDMTFDVEDTAGQVWREGCIGWAVTVSRRRIDGTVRLVDMTKWVGSKWDTGTWDTDKWSYAVTIPALEEEE